MPDSIFGNIWQYFMDLRSKLDQNHQFIAYFSKVQHKGK
jgi:hypothetical protein